MPGKVSAYLNRSGGIIRLEFDPKGDGKVTYLELDLEFAQATQNVLEVSLATAYDYTPWAPSSGPVAPKYPPMSEDG